MTTHEEILAHDGLHETIRELRATKAELLEACKAAKAILASSGLDEEATFLLLHRAIQKAEAQP